MIRVLLADDEHLIRSALAALLELEDDIEVVAQADDGRQALELIRYHRPDVSVLDLRMPAMDGVEVADALRGASPAFRIVIVTGHGLPGHLRRALAAGVRGFVPKTVTAQDLTRVIRSVHAGNRYVDARLAADAISVGESPLSAREAGMLSLASDGAPVAVVARRAGLSQGTVRNYLSAATIKLGAENRYEASHIARVRGWIS